MIKCKMLSEAQNRPPLQIPAESVRYLLGNNSAQTLDRPSGPLPGIDGGVSQFSRGLQMAPQPGAKDPSRFDNSIQLLLAREQRQASFQVLEEAAKANDTRSFVTATKVVDWGMCQPKDFIRAVDLALSLSAFAVARDISEKGHRQYPKHPGLRQHALVLASPKILRADLPVDSTVEKNEGWLKKHGREFRGHWIAVRNGQLLGSADTLTDLIAKVGKTPETLMTLID